MFIANVKIIEIDDAIINSVVMGCAIPERKIYNCTAAQS